MRVVSFAKRLVSVNWWFLQWLDPEGGVDMAGPGSFADKVVIDPTNPLRFVAEGQPPELVVGLTDSAGEQVKRWFPPAKVVKAFNIVGNPHMVDPSFPDGKPDMFIAGNDEGAKQQVSGLVRELGWPPAVDRAASRPRVIWSPWRWYGLATSSEAASTATTPSSCCGNRSRVRRRPRALPDPSRIPE